MVIFARQSDVCKSDGQLWRPAIVQRQAWFKLHKGMDFRARIPARRCVPETAARWCWRAPSYYEGNCVVIDHGLGLFTLSMHLSRIRCTKDSRSRMGECLG